MKELIKTIRTISGMSQEQFASDLGMILLSVNRRENGKAHPNRTQRTGEEYLLAELAKPLPNP